MYLLSGANDSEIFMSTTTTEDSSSNRINTSNQEEDILDDYVVISPVDSTEDQTTNDNNCDDDYYAEFDWPDDIDDGDLEYFEGDNNDEVFLNKHLNCKQLELVEDFEKQPYKRSKRSNKKINAQRQIKTKYAQTVKTNSHNKKLYMHHRLFKQVCLDPPSQNYLPTGSTVPLKTRAELRSIANERYNNKSSNRNQSAPPTTAQNPNQRLHEYTVNEHTMQRLASFDDAMIAFLMDMQNRDLSPEDYEMLLRLDERVQRKTVDTNVLNKLPTVNVNEIHIHDQCAICMETYTIGQQLKLLPCKHMFHIHCIDTYLKEFSVQCPLDNLPLV